MDYVDQGQAHRARMVAIPLKQAFKKLERRFLALNHLAAAIIAFRKVPLAINIIYG